MIFFACAAASCPAQPKPPAPGAKAKAAAASRTPHAEASRESRFAIEVKQLESLARALKNEDKPGDAYRRLSEFADRHAKDELGARAALALGYYDYNQARYPEARAWLDRAKGETLLAEYVLYWSAQTDIGLGNNAEALAQLETFRSQYPQSVMNEMALESLVQTALAANQPQVALAALASVGSAVETNPPLLFMRGQAHEQTGDKLAAAYDYLAIYDKYPTSEQAPEAAAKVQFLESVMGADFPKPLASEQMTRAGLLFYAHQWQAAADAYTSVAPLLGGSDLELAKVLAAECRVQLGGGPGELAALQLQTPDNDAARYYYLSQAYRSIPDETNMLAAVQQDATRYPTSTWTEQAIFATGNFYWVKLNRDEAAKWYQQLVDKFPSSAQVPISRWHIAWTAYMDRSAGAQSLFEKYLKDYPTSSNVPNALYWLGRLAQRAGAKDVARAYFEKLRERFANDYFAIAAAAQLRRLGRGRVAPLPVLDVIAPLPHTAKMDAPVSAAAFPSVQRAFALETIAFDDSAVLEFRSAFSETHAASLQLSIARASVAAENYAAAMSAARYLYPVIESRPIASVPRDIWKLAYPLPYRDQIRADARRAHVDPMLVAALIRQESQFDKKAISRSNAYGLMQLLPITAQELARGLRIHYSDDALFDPVFNLDVGVVDFAKLLETFHTPEAALAAYNAGADRVTAWQAGQKYAELPEFVESIPFTQTRQYVQIIMRNEKIYRAIYGER